MWQEERRRHDPPATLGAITVNEIARYREDLAMVSPFGLDATAGAMSYIPTK
jgi:DeoR family fructose operon transcriptional repressor